MASASSTVVAMGFSTRTCLPAAAAAMVCSACSLSGVAITTASRSGSDRKCCRSSKAGAGEAALCSCAKRTAFALSRLSTLHNVAPPTSPMAGVSASRLMLPVPIIPSRNMVYPKVQSVDSTREPAIYDTVINRALSRSYGGIVSR